MLVRLEGGALPDGYYVSQGRKCRVYLAELWGRSGAARRSPCSAYARCERALWTAKDGSTDSVVRGNDAQTSKDLLKRAEEVMPVEPPPLPLASPPQVVSAAVTADANRAFNNQNTKQ